MRVTSTGIRRSTRSAAIPPRPAPTMTTRGLPLSARSLRAIMTTPPPVPVPQARPFWPALGDDRAQSRDERADADRRDTAIASRLSAHARWLHHLETERTPAAARRHQDLR